MITCEICASKRKRLVKCPMCNVGACQNCVARYAVDHDDCMHCHGVHSDEFFTFLPKNVHNAREARTTYRVYQEQIQLVPSAQPYARFLDRVEELKSRIAEMENELVTLHQPPLVGEAHIACPAPECSGYVSLTSHLCGKCNGTFCVKCKQMHGEREPCEEDALLSNGTVANTTRSCPSCRVPIERVSGCNDMFCVRCKTPFRWSTGQVIRGSFHNPHADGRVRPDNPETRCGGIPTKLEVGKVHFWTPTEFGYVHCAGVCLVCETDILNTKALRAKLDKMNANDFNRQMALARVAFVRDEDADKFRETVLNIERRRRTHERLKEIIQTHLCTISDVYDSFVHACSQNGANLFDENMKLHEAGNANAHYICEELDKLRKRNECSHGIAKIRRLVLGYR